MRPALVVAALLAGCGEPAPDPAQVALGQKVYAQHCAACHGAKLEGQPNWRARLPSGRMPAPPHDDSGHTWHHPNDVLFGITKHGLVPPYAPPGYQSDMPAFAGTLSDAEIRAVLAYIASHWSTEIVKLRAEMTQHQPRR
ncbi:MAG TPA: cytochrome c [Burkholderiales bacterium]|nr:cytochrome c [Burkholderiales bacterium]